MTHSLFLAMSQSIVQPISHSFTKRDDDDIDYDEMTPEVRNAYAAYYRHIAYTKQTVYFTSCIIFLALLFHLFFMIKKYAALRQKRGCSGVAPPTVEAQIGPGERHLTAKFSIRRMPVAILNFLRIVWCRYNIQVDPFDWTSRFTMIEIAIPVAYWIALLTWTFVNCELNFTIPICL